MGNIGVVELLLSRGAKAHEGKRFKTTPLNIAASQGYTEICDVLLNAGPREEMLRFRDRLAGRTASQWAARRGHKELAAMLKA